MFIICVVVTVVLVITLAKPKTTSDVTFQRVDYMAGSCLENFYDQPIDNPTWEDVTARIRKMMDVNDEHVLLTLKQSVYGVRYMQAASAPGGYDLQVGMEEGDQTKLVDKIVDSKELFDRFEIFYRYAYVDNLGEFKPVEFYAK
jgi:hypothetical protein